MGKSREILDAGYRVESPVPSLTRREFLSLVSTVLAGSVVAACSEGDGEVALESLDSTSSFANKMYELSSGLLDVAQELSDGGINQPMANNRAYDLCSVIIPLFNKAMSDEGFYIDRDEFEGQVLQLPIAMPVDLSNHTHAGFVQRNSDMGILRQSFYGPDSTTVLLVAEDGKFAFGVSVPANGQGNDGVMIGRIFANGELKAGISHWVQNGDLYSGMYGPDLTSGLSDGMDGTELVMADDFVGSMFFPIGALDIARDYGGDLFERRLRDQQIIESGGEDIIIL